MTYIHEALAKGQIRRSRNIFDKFILFILKKGRTLYLYVDYSAFNTVTKKDRTPLLLIKNILKYLSSAAVYTKLDLKNAYYRIRIRPGNKQKTVQRYRYSYFKYITIPFGLTNILAIFQSYIKEILGDFVNICYIVYLGDILIYSKDRKIYIYI